MNYFNSLSALACPRLCEKEKIFPHSELGAVIAKHQARVAKGMFDSDTQ